VKGVILCGGYGTRLKPCTEEINKHLLPVFDKPMVFYPISTLVELGITNICVVLGGESVGDFIRLLGDGSRFGKDVKFTYVYQPEAGGIAEAIGLCENFINGDKFIVILGDNLFLGGSLHDFKTGFEKFNDSCRLVFAKVEHPEKYGVPRFEFIYEGAVELVEIIEKPKKPPSNYATTGIYAFTSEIFDIIKELKPSARGELEIAEAITLLLKRGMRVGWEVFDGSWFDCGGSFDNLLESTIAVRTAKRCEL